MMKLVLCVTMAVALSVAVAASLARGEEDMFAPSPGLTILTPENADSIIGGDKAVLVAFKAPWCGHCKNMVGEYKRLGAAVAAAGGAAAKVVVAKVDADKHGQLSGKYGVSGFPTIKFFPAGSKDAQDYEGGRTAEDFIKFLNDKAGAGLFLPYVPSDITELTPVNHDKVIKESKFALVAYTAKWCGHCKSMKPALAAAAKAFASEKGVVIANVDADAHRSLGEKVGVQGFPTIKFYENGGAAQDYSAGRSTEDFVAFVNSKAGTRRAADGSLDAEAGTTPELNAAAAAYSANGDKSAFAGAANAWYEKIAQSIDAKGADYVDKELARVAKLLDGGKLSAAKRDDLTFKKNALTAFKK